MNWPFNASFLGGVWFKRGVVAVFLAAFLMLAAAIAKLFLPQTSVEKRVFVPFNYYRPYAFDRAFAITDAPSAAPKSTVNLLKTLKVKAIYAEQDGNGFVVVEEGKSVIFISRGEEFKGYTLAKLESRRAVFMKDGQPVEIVLEEKTPAARLVDAGSRAAAIPGDTPQLLRNVERAEMERYRQDARLIWDNIGINPVTENGQFKEFRVTFVAKGSMFEQLGLQAGDVLKTANGIELDGYAAALRLYSEIDKMESFRLTIVRNNQIRELDYEIR